MFALEDECDDLDDSLVVANPGALDEEVADFELLESDVLPAWAQEAVAQKRPTFVERWRSGQ